MFSSSRVQQQQEWKELHVHQWQHQQQQLQQQQQLRLQCWLVLMVQQLLAKVAMQQQEVVFTAAQGWMRVWGGALA
jgi:hypothetical protein